MLSVAPTAWRERALAKLLPQNGLLAALPAEAQNRLLRHLGLADLRQGQRLLGQGGACVRAFFPLAGLVSLTQALRDGRQVQVALVGAEGLLALPLLTGGSRGPIGATVQCAGYGLALGREPLMDEWDRGGQFKEILLRYSQTLRTEMSCLARCRRDHTVEQRLGTLMLMTLDRLPGQEGVLPPDRTAQLLGVSSERVAQAVRGLRDSGVLTIRRDGAMAVADRPALQQKACACHRRIRGQQQVFLAAAQGAVQQPRALTGQPRINASISSALTGTPREINSQPLSATIASSSMRMPML